MDGNGLLLRDPGKLPPSARKQLEQVGNEKVTKIVAVRTPLSSTTKAFLNIISLGQFEKISKKYFDDLFHLAFWINDKYNLEKNEVISFGTKNPIKSNSETQTITVNKSLTFNELMENTRKYMGDNNFTSYNAEKNNCQNFLLGILNGNGLGTDAEKKWIKQDTEQVFKEVPTFAKVLGNLATTAGAVVDRLVQGEGRPRRLYITDDGKYYYMKGKKKRFVKMPEGISQKQVVKINLANLVKPKKKRRRRRKTKREVKAEFLPGTAIGKFGPPPVIAKIEKGDIKKEANEIAKTIESLYKIVPREPLKLPEPEPKVESKGDDTEMEIVNAIANAEKYYVNEEGVLDIEDKQTFNSFLNRVFKGLPEDERKKNILKYSKNQKLNDLFDAKLEEWTTKPPVESVSTETPLLKKSESSSTLEEFTKTTGQPIVGNPVALLRSRRDVMPSLRNRAKTEEEKLAETPSFSKTALKGKGMDSCYNPLSIAYANMPIGLEVGNPTIKTEALTGTTMPVSTTETKKPEKEEPQKPDQPQKGQGLFSDIAGLYNPALGMSTRVLGLGYGMGGGCQTCQCGNGVVGDFLNTATEKFQKLKAEADADIQLRKTNPAEWQRRQDAKKAEMDRLKAEIEKEKKRKEDERKAKEAELNRKLNRPLEWYEKAGKFLTGKAVGAIVPGGVGAVAGALLGQDVECKMRDLNPEECRIFRERQRGGADPEEEPEPTEELDLQDEIELIDEEIDNLGRESDEIEAEIQRLRVSLRSWGRTEDRGPSQNMFVRAIRQRLGPLIERQQEIVDEIEELIQLRQQRVDALRGGGDVDGLYNDEIETIADNLGIKVPVIASDEIDKIVKMINPSTKEFGFIVNTDSSSGPGKHWRAVFIDNDEERPSIEYFDPLGDAPETQLIDDMKKIVDKLGNEKYFLFKENMVKRQADDTDTCGHFSLKFLEDRFNGVPWVDATGFKKCINQSGVGEKEIAPTVKKYENYL